MGKNEELGLPFGDGMQKVAICFDVDGTLINEDKPLRETQMLLMALLAQKWKNVDVIIWSGGGMRYAELHARRHMPGIERGVKFMSKLDWESVKLHYDAVIAIDDIQDTRLGDVNLIVRNK